MSLITKLEQNWHDNVDSVRDDIINNIATLISGRAPIWPVDDHVSGTIAGIGMRNISPYQSKSKSTDIVNEITKLICQFEPRLSQVEIEIQTENQGSLKFRLFAVMHSAAGDDVLVLDSWINLINSSLDIRRTNLV